VLLGQPRPGLDSSPAFWSAYASGQDNSTTNVSGLREALAFAAACCFLATAVEDESQYSRYSIKAI